MLVRFLPALFAIGLYAGSRAQSNSMPGAQQYVDYYDSTRTHKRSEGLMVNGREWNEWKFYSRDGHLTERAEFKSGERDGRTILYYDNDSVQHNGFIRFCKQYSTIRRYYRNGQLMEEERYVKGVKSGTWN